MFTQITNNSRQEIRRPEIFGNLVVYSAQNTLFSVDPTSDVYIYDLSTRQNRDLAVSSTAEYVAGISGNRVLIYDAGSGSLRLMNSNGNPISANIPQNANEYAAIDGNTIVFADDTNNNVIGVYNIGNQTTSYRTLNSSAPKVNLDISNNNIVYRQNNDIWAVTTSGTGLRKLSAAFRVSSPRISGNNVVFRETVTRGNGFQNSIQVYNLSTNQKTNLNIPNINSDLLLSEPDISGNKVVSFGIDANGNRRLYASYVDGSNLTALTNPGEVRSANIVSLSGNNAVWSDVDPQLNDFELYSLTVAIDPLFRFYNPQSKGHFFTANPQERDIVLSRSDWGYEFEGVGFKNSITEGIGLRPVYRFYNPVSRGHFFTINEAEKDIVLNRPEWGYEFEGVGFHGFGAESNQGTDIFRFYNAASRGHFFTGSVQERDNILADPGLGYTYEGVGFRGYI